MLKSIIKYGFMFIFALISTGTVLAQRQITEGTLSITYTVDSFRLSKKTVYEDVKISFKENYLKINSSYSYFNRLNESCIIYHLAKPNLLLLTETSGIKIAINMPKAYYEEFLNSNDGRSKIPDGIELLNASIIDFQPTGQKEQINGYACEKLTTDMPGGEKLTIWTTEEVLLPFDFLKYEIGTLNTLLNGKKIKGTLLRLQYANKLEATVKLDTQKVIDISMEVPPGYFPYDISQIIGTGTNKPKKQ